MCVCLRVTLQPLLLHFYFSHPRRCYRSGKKGEIFDRVSVTYKPDLCRDENGGADLMKKQALDNEPA